MIDWTLVEFVKYFENPMCPKIHLERDWIFKKQKETEFYWKWYYKDITHYGPYGEKYEITGAIRGIYFTDPEIAMLFKLQFQL